ncbi:MAG TPA: hypothetical protein VF189_04470 [Patescibacteria group bacterium]
MEQKLLTVVDSPAYRIWKDQRSVKRSEVLSPQKSRIEKVKTLVKIITDAMPKRARRLKNNEYWNSVHERRFRQEVSEELGIPVDRLDSMRNFALARSDE